MIHTDESENEQEVNYNNILYDDNIGDGIEYYNDNLPHINFYLKFQKKHFLQNFFNEIEKEKGKKCIEKGKEEKICEDKESDDKIKEKDKNIKINELNVLNEGGFYIDDIPEECSDNSTENFYENPFISLSENIFHLDENEEQTKKINLIFQNHKNKFTFSIERILENDETSEQKCFLCYKKKKFNKILVNIKIYVCNECKSIDSNFRMISLSKLINKYCLNNYDLLKYEKQLALFSTKNPRGYLKQMKLYFLFQIKEIAIRKYGSLEKVKNLYNSKILNIRNKKVIKKNIHKLKKPKNIYSKEMMNMNKYKIICDNNEHDFDPPYCINQNDNIYKKNCKKCSYYVEYMQF
ncbi:DNA repair protein RAD14, putative [Plasmodium gallinaceum]|uniref:DNA repair protein RAD14, putative n=1 Tax=Plasmodium gallinaceum TaxID=5849 RepID=A0A1J1GZM8_PLAGA|nr:DNA repair protein RAD14, putative [Plasmodium gallinaceum]CRG98070.1 DNA repair protein RAD14, putative [Plasmodium gallinaceum]